MTATTEMDPRSQYLTLELGELPKQDEAIVNSVKELRQFLLTGEKGVKAVALRTYFSMSGSEKGIWTLLAVPETLFDLMSLLQDEDVKMSKDAASCLINISADQYGPRELLNLDKDYIPPNKIKPKSIIDECLKHIFNKESLIADECCMLLSNLSRNSVTAKQSYELLIEANYQINDIINIFTKVQYNQKKCSLDYLGPWLSNLSQDRNVRRSIFESINVVNNLMSYTTYKKSVVKRGGIVGVLRNLCFDLIHHEFLVFEVDILPCFLLPLAGPEQFDNEDQDTLPCELQYLPDDKQRESDPAIRQMLVEAITQLCTLRKYREYIRSKGTYLILRELHKCETQPAVITAVENLVDLMIRTEEEIGMDNLRSVEIPGFFVPL